MKRKNKMTVNYMLKNIKINLKSINICHASLDGEFGERFPLSLRSAGMTQQAGRSMMEMLGVLAIIGIISVGGLYGFNVVMKRHRANELINDAQKCAVMVASQIALGRKPSDEADQSLIGEFPDSTDHEFKVKKANDNQFNIEISSVSGEVCEELEKMIGGVIRAISTCPSGTTGTIALTFNNDMSQTPYASDYKTPNDCMAHFTWCSGASTPYCAEDCCTGINIQCQECTEDGTITNKEGTCDLHETNDGFCNNGVCTDYETGPCSSFADTSTSNTGGAVPTATECKCPAGQIWGESGCVAVHAGDSCTTTYTNADCGGNDSGFYCKATGTGALDVVPNGGTCQPKGSLIDITLPDGVTVVYTQDTEMSWWASQQFCVAHGKDPATRNTFTGANTPGSHDDNDPNSLYAKFSEKFVIGNQLLSLWLEDSDIEAYNFAAYALYVSRTNGVISGRNHNSESNTRPLCVNR